MRMRFGLCCVSVDNAGLHSASAVRPPCSLQGSLSLFGHPRGCRAHSVPSALESMDIFFPGPLESSSALAVTVNVSIAFLLP